MDDKFWPLCRFEINQLKYQSMAVYLKKTVMELLLKWYWRE